MSVFQILKLSSGKKKSISLVTCSAFEGLKILERYLSDEKQNSKFKKVKSQRDRKNINGVASADLMLVANDIQAIKPRSKRLIKPIYYKGEILYGTHPVYLALLERRRHLFQLFIRKYSETCFSLEKIERINKIEKVAKTLRIPVHNLYAHEMEYLAPGSVHQGVCLDAGSLPVLEWADARLIENEESFNLPTWLILNEILDPMNVGAVIRSAHYFGIRKLFVVKESSCKLSPTVSKASSGALEVMDIYQIEKLESFLQIKKTEGWNIISTVAYCENQSEISKQIIDIADFKTSKPTILILGNEGKGISLEIQKLCDTFVSIPPKNSLHPGIDSLNVSVAAGVILYSLSSRRQG